MLMLPAWDEVKKSGIGVTEDDIENSLLYLLLGNCIISIIIVHNKAASPQTPPTHGL